MQTANHCGSQDVCKRLKRMKRRIKSEQSRDGIQQIKQAIESLLQDLEEVHEALHPDESDEPTDDESTAFSSEEQEDEEDEETEPVGLERGYHADPDGTLSFRYPTDWTQEKIDDVHSVVARIPTEVMSQCYFDTVRYVGRIYEQLLRLGPQIPSHHEMKQLFGGGKTQAGKTALKVVAMVAVHILSRRRPELNACCVVCTPGVKAAKNLLQKMKGMLQHFSPDDRPNLMGITKNVHGASQVLLNGPQFSESLHESIQTGGSIVTALTASQLNKVMRLIAVSRGCGHSARFVMLLDEADDAIRTRDPTSGPKLEQALDRLLGGHGSGGFKGPQFIVNISATLAPVFFHLFRNSLARNTTAEDIFYVATSDDYHDISSLKPLADAEGQDVFLDHNELKPSNNYISPKVLMLFQDLMSKQHGRRRGGLLLDISSPRVNTTDGSIFSKADYMQRLFPGLVAVVVHGARGSGIQWRAPCEQGGRPSRNGWKDVEANKSMPDALEMLDHKFPQVPIAVFGYSRMIRSETFRSSTRIPTHTLVSLGMGQSLDKLVQAVGRASFRGAHMLTESGWDHVTILTTAPDFDNMNAYQAWQMEVHKKMEEQNLTLEQCLQPEQIYNFASNFGDCRRDVGNRKAGLSGVMQQSIQWEPRPATQAPPRGEQWAQRQAQHDPFQLMILGVLDEASAVNSDVAKMSAQEVLEEIMTGSYGDVTMFQDRGLLVPKQVKHALDTLHGRGVVEREAAEPSQGRMYRYWLIKQDGIQHWGLNQSRSRFLEPRQ